MAKMFKKYDDDDYLDFASVAEKFSGRPDLHAFMLLDRLQPHADWDIIAAAEHDIIYLKVDCIRLSEVITEAQVQDLVRCGVRYNEDSASLTMFV